MNFNRGDSKNFFGIFWAIHIPVALVVVVAKVLSKTNKEVYITTNDDFTKKKVLGCTYIVTRVPIKTPKITEFV